MGRVEDILQVIKDDEKIDGKTLKVVIMTLYKVFLLENSNIQEEIKTIKEILKRHNEEIISLKNTSKNNQEEFAKINDNIKKLINYIKNISSSKQDYISPEKENKNQPIKEITNTSSFPITPRSPNKKSEFKPLQTTKIDEQKKENISQILKEKQLKEDNNIEPFIGTKEQYNVIGKFTQTITEWVGLSKCKVIYDSLSERSINKEETGKSFGEHVMNKPNICFFNFDENENVFGVFTSKEITEFDSEEHDDSMFCFLLKTKRIISVPKKWNIKKSINCAISIKRDSSVLYSFGQTTGNGFVEIAKTWLKQSWSHNISSSFLAMNENALVGSNDSTFTVQRIIVLEFY
ncbi:hypothetical protein ENUP19_0274G0032 [Entamoeba nuttalli]|uniref:TLDc domain-containing protein n=2 Tax=Entamoeba nuttalli TaxID=412467 RepID=K2HWT2_ENTNP|nr:hypothetical protein ENU1_081560 [Entamoeba nuttalli P19]EKE40715.1 hypothetical protein ENU1_081560 [Entamoeba nuttalli P19]|eukprot:XP_008856951.1 hypothetical protein ENU1_081560 [Entamoeba nuttalli P19]